MSDIISSKEWLHRAAEAAKVGRTGLLIVRHEVHGEDAGRPKNVLGRRYKERAFNTGAILAGSGIIVTGEAVSSPQWRCVSTLGEILEGMSNSVGKGHMPPLRTCAMLGDLAMDPSFTADAISILESEARAAKRDPEQFFVTSERFRPLVHGRGHIGASALLSIVQTNPGKISVACSHGGSRIEPSVAVLEAAANLPDSKNRRAWQPEYWWQRGDVGLLLFDGMNKLVEILPPIGLD